MTDLVIIGAGAFAREVHDVIEDLAADGEAWNLLGFIDDHPPEDGLIEARGSTVLGGDAVLATLPAGTAYVIAINAPAARRRIDALAGGAGLRPATLIHPQATLGRANTVGEGVIICSHVSITTNVMIGRHVHINLNSTIGHDVVLHDYVTINPGVNVSGNVDVGAEAMLGTGSAVLQGVTIGERAVVGMGSAVLRTVAAGATVVGVPAKQLGPVR